MPQPGDLNFFKSILIIETMQLKSVTELKSRNIYICSGRCLTGKCYHSVNVIEFT